MSQSHEGLIAGGEAVASRPMKLFMAFFVWFLMAAILVKGLLLAIDGHIGLLAAGIVGFVVLCAKIGCLTHD